MAKLEHIYRPVLDPSLTERMRSIGDSMLSEIAFIYPTDQLRQEPLNPFETDHIPDLNRNQSDRISAELEKIRESQPAISVPITTTKFLIKSGKIILGLEQDEALRSDRARVVNMLASIIGAACEFPLERKYFGITVGKTVERSNETYGNIIHSLTDHVLEASDSRIRLGRIIGELSFKSMKKIRRL